MFVKHYLTPLFYGDLGVDNFLPLCDHMPMEQKSKDTLKDTLKEYLDKYGLAPSRFADMAGVPRYSIVRYVNQEDANLLYPTREKVSSYMMQNP